MRGEVIHTNYVKACSIVELPVKMDSGVWWLIHIQSKTSFWESWGMGRDENASVRKGKVGSSGSSEKLEWGEVVDEAKKLIQRGYAHVAEARAPVKTEMMPGGYARTSVVPTGTYGVSFSGDEKPKEELPPAWRTRTVLPKVPPKNPPAPRPKMKDPSKTPPEIGGGAFREEGLLGYGRSNPYGSPVSRSTGHRPGFVEEKEQEKMQELAKARAERRIAEEKKAAEEAEKARKEKDIDTIKGMMNKRKQESEW